ncbi:MAG TPA: hypothetical protein VJY15_13685 [Candidatus Acidoferrum sp.]|nr:hypothetical protein [Candidatus Acidoferrum sp.]
MASGGEQELTGHVIAETLDDVFRHTVERAADAAGAKPDMRQLMHQGE